MQFAAKLLVANIFIVFCVLVGRTRPSLAGLLSVAPTTGLVVLAWIYSEHPGQYARMAEYARGVVWGLAPTLLFFGAAWFCFRRELPLSAALGAGFALWLLGAAVHQRLLG